MTSLVDDAGAPTGEPRAYPREYERMSAHYFNGGLSRSDWDAWYDAQLRGVLRHVTERSDFYRRHLAGVDLSAVSPRSMGLLPFTTKADLRREMGAVLSGGPSDALIFYETTGTTGPSTPCPRGANDLLASNRHVEESWRRQFAHYFGDRMPVIGLMGPSELYAFGDTFGDVAQRMGACHVKIWPESPRVGFRKALRLMRELGVEVVVCAPALCLNLAKAAIHNGLDPRADFDVAMFGVLGEICTPAFAENVTSVWGAQVHATLYGSQEALAVATGCTGRRLHLSQPNYLVEILDPDTGESRGRVGEGELCLTMLIPGIKPLIRYRTGDLVSVRPDDCGCDMPGDVIEVVGRVADRVTVGGRHVRPADIETAVLDGVRGCLGYRVEIDRDGAGADVLTVELDLVPGADVAEIRTAMTARLADRLGVRADVRATAELDPITNTGAFVSWKAARIADLRSEADDAAQVARQVAAQHAYTT